MITHPAAGLNMRLGRGLDPLARQPQPIGHRLRILSPLMTGRPIRPASGLSVALQRPPQPKHRLPLPLQPAQRLPIGYIELEADHRHRAVVLEVRGLGLTAAPRHSNITAGGGDVGRRGCHVAMKPSPTDINPLSDAVTCCRSPD
jgi:hypothetical protein